MNKKKLYNRLIAVTSIVIPVVVAILFRVRIPNVEPLDQLPPIYAGINALTAIFLLIALVAIKQGKRKLHERLMKVNILFSLAFLVMYIAYHMTSDPTPYGIVDGIFVASQTSKIIYFTILISHIILSIVLIPLVLVAYSKTVLVDFVAHKKIARIAFPIWLYVTITGVVVYFMISPFYT
jgi:putative membrane protein